MIYTCAYFNLRELLYPEVYFALKKENINKGWLLFRKETLITADLIREFIGAPININSYSEDFLKNPSQACAKESGLRHFESKTGAKYSQHKYGGALDLKFNSKMWDPETLREYMRVEGCFDPKFRKFPSFDYFGIINEVQNHKGDMIEFIYTKTEKKIRKEIIPFMFITAIEWLYMDKPNKMKWFHFDNRNSIDDRIQIIYK